jgi:hypothetical protein
MIVVELVINNANNCDFMGRMIIIEYPHIV